MTRDRVLGQLKRGARGTVAIAVVALCGLMSLPPSLSTPDRAALAGRFRFTRELLPVPAHAEHNLRAVNPSYEPIASWISAVGASVALSDIAGTGLPADICHVDTATDQVIVAPVPGTEQRYPPFALDPRPLTYDSASMAPMGCLPGDLNEDGLTDLLVYFWGRPPIAFMHRPPTDSSPRGRLSAASFVPREIVRPTERWYSNSATLADLDGDGHLDLVVGNYFPDGSHVLDSGGGPQAMTSSLARSDNGGSVHFLRWESARGGDDPDLSFSDIRGVLPASAAHGWTLAVGAADLNGDLRPEIYLANDFGPDRLLVNHSSPGHIAFSLAEGSKGFTTPSSKVLGHDSFKGMGVAFGDLDQRGLTDIVVSDITSPFALQESNLVFMNTGDQQALGRGGAPFVDRSEPMGLARSGWAWDVKLADFDNRGQLEVLQAVGFLSGHVNRWPELQELSMANQALLSDTRIWPRFRPGDDLSGHERNTFYARAADGRYYDVGAQLGLGQDTPSRSIAVADVDGDGRLDFAVANQWGRSYVFHNRSPAPGRFLSLDLELPLAGTTGTGTRLLSGHPADRPGGRPAIGAEVTVRFPDGRRLLTQVDGGNGHGGKSAPGVHIGLGDMASDRPVQVDLRWRDASGGVHGETLNLIPGSYTVMLASDTGSQA